MEPIPPGAWTAATVAAVHASWRLVIVVASVTALPASSMTVVSAVVFGETTVIPLVVAFVLFTVSPFVHEFAHAATQVVLADERRSVVGGVGGWGHGQIIRWTLPASRDGLVAIAGPLAASASGLIVLTLPLPYLVAYPVTILFTVHVLSLKRSAPDGRQLLVALKGENCARDSGCVQVLRPGVGPQ